MIYQLLNFLRTVIWTSVFSVILVAASILTSLLTDLPLLSISFAISAVALAIISKQD